MRTTIICTLLACALAPAGALAEPALARQAAANAALPAATRLSAADLGARARLRHVRIAPQGHLTAFVEQDGAMLNIKLLDHATGQRRQLLALQSPVAEVNWARDGETLFVDTGASLTSVALRDGATVEAAKFDRKLGQGFVAIDQSRPHHALVEENDSASKDYRVVRVGPDGAREVLYQGRKLDQFVVGADAKAGFIRFTNDKGARVISQRRAGEWVEVAHCSPKQEDCAIAGASADASCCACWTATTASR